MHLLYWLLRPKRGRGGWTAKPANCVCVCAFCDGWCRMLCRINGGKGATWHKQGHAHLLTGADVDAARLGADDSDEPIVETGPMEAISAVAKKW